MTQLNGTHDQNITANLLTIFLHDLKISSLNTVLKNPFLHAQTEQNRLVVRAGIDHDDLLAKRVIWELFDKNILDSATTTGVVLKPGEKSLNRKLEFDFFSEHNDVAYTGNFWVISIARGKINHGALLHEAIEKIRINPKEALRALSYANSFENGTSRTDKFDRLVSTVDDVTTIGNSIASAGPDEALTREFSDAVFPVSRRHIVRALQDTQLPRLIGETLAFRTASELSRLKIDPPESFEFGAGI